MCFAWDDAEQMHIFRGRKAGVSEAERKAKALNKSRKEWVMLFVSAEIGTGTQGGLYKDPRVPFLRNTQTTPPSLISSTAATGGGKFTPQ